MHVFIDFWKLEIENNLLHVFSFLHKLNFENSFYFLPILSCQTSFLVLKIENCFWKQKIREKKQLPNIPLISFKHHVEKEMLLFAGNPVVIRYCWYISQWSLSGWSSLDGEFESHDSCIVDS